MKAVCDYGSKLGVSSRGNGDIITGPDGEPTVDEDSYETEIKNIIPGRETVLSAFLIVL